MKKATVVGAGLVGSLWSVYLAQMGYRVNIYERRTDMRKAKLNGGRSINLALSDRGWKALEKVGLRDHVNEMAIPMYGRVIHTIDGQSNFQPYGIHNEAIYSVSRGGLNAVLMDLAEKQGNVNIHFEHSCHNVDLERGSASFIDKSSGKTVIADDGLIFGTDGANSTVRTCMQRGNRFNFSQEYIEHGYKELNILPNKDGSHKIEKEALHIWPRGEFMLIALPNKDGSFTCTLFHPYHGEEGFDALNTDKKITAFFKKYFPDAFELMPNLLESWHSNPTSNMVIIHCNPWTANGRVALMGDASHAIVPFYGQGMNAGFEDCTVLKDLFDNLGNDWNRAMRAYELERKPNADAIANLAMQNFLEMRDKTGDPKFLLRKKIEHSFSRKYPGNWMPLYSMVTFSHLPYKEAFNAGVFQDKIMDRVMEMADIEECWDSDEVHQFILQQLERSENA